MTDINDQINDLNAKDLGDRDNDAPYPTDFKVGDMVSTMSGIRGEIISIDLDPETSSNKISIKINDGQDMGEVVEVSEKNVQKA